MIIGQTSFFAIESEINVAFPRRSLQGLGYFRIHVGGIAYGVKAPDATMLANSFDEVNTRVAARGSHQAHFGAHADAGELADTIAASIYGPEVSNTLAKEWPEERMMDALTAGRIVWAPDGDEAFDDSSLVVHFDIGDRVRIVGFKRDDDHTHHVPASLRDVSMQADSFYGILQHWSEAFTSERDLKLKDPDNARLLAMYPG